MIENQNIRLVAGKDQNLKVNVRGSNKQAWSPAGTITYSYKMTDGTNTLSLTQTTITISGGVVTIPILGAATTAFTPGDYDHELTAVDDGVPESIMRGTVTLLKKVAT